MGQLGRSIRDDERYLGRRIAFATRLFPRLNQAVALDCLATEEPLCAIVALGKGFRSGYLKALNFYWWGSRRFCCLGLMHRELVCSLCRSF